MTCGNSARRLSRHALHPAHIPYGAEALLPGVHASIRSMESGSTLRAALKDRELELLEQAIDAEQAPRPGLLDLPVDELSADHLNDLRDSVTVLFCMYGLDKHDEVNDFGEEREELIARIAPWNWGKGD